MTTREDYVQLLTALQPVGQAWNTEEESVQMAVRRIQAAEFFYLHQRSDILVNECIPSGARELLEDWEAEYGLPDNCSPLADTLPERVASLVEKVTRVGGQSRQFYIDVAAMVGYEIEITEHTPFMCGISHCGTDPLTEGHDIRFVWWVKVLNTKLLYLRCGQSTLDQPLLDFRTADDLACLLHKLKASHTELVIGY